MEKRDKYRTAMKENLSASKKVPKKEDIMKLHQKLKKAAFSELKQLLKDEDQTFSQQYLTILDKVKN